MTRARLWLARLLLPKGWRLAPPGSTIDLNLTRDIYHRGDLDVDGIRLNGYRLFATGNVSFRDGVRAGGG